MIAYGVMLCGTLCQSYGIFQWSSFSMTWFSMTWYGGDSMRMASRCVVPYGVWYNVWYGMIWCGGSMTMASVCVESKGYGRI